MRLQNLRLENLGWSPSLAEAFRPYASEGFSPGRVAGESREIYQLLTEGGELRGELTGALRYRAQGPEELPVVGDWVAFQAFAGGPAVIHALLPRRTHLARRAAGVRGGRQLVAANLDTVFVVTSLNRELNLRRLERYLALVRQGGVRPVLLLSKSDLVADVDPARRRVQSVAGGAPVLAMSALAGTGLEGLAAFLCAGETVALVGSSGVGKSTLVNRLLGRERQAVREVREEDDRGRHTTSRRELIPLPGGALLVDTPGMRELGLTGGGEAAGAFGEIEELAADCRFRDCRHDGEPGCAVEAAVTAGRLGPERLAGYHKLLREESYQADRLARSATYAEKRKWRTLLARLDRRS